MTSRRSASIVLAVVAGLMAVAEVVWVVGFLGSSQDGPAFVMALVATVLIPIVLAATGAVLLETVPRWTRLACVGAVAAAGLAAAGVEAGVFVGDDPTDPAFIHSVADAPVFAFFVAVVLSGAALWGVSGSLPMPVRALVTAVLAVVGSVVLAGLLLTGLPMVVLLGLATPVALVVVALVSGRRQRRRLAL